MGRGPDAVKETRLVGRGVIRPIGPIRPMGRGPDAVKVAVAVDPLMISQYPLADLRSRGYHALIC